MNALLKNLISLEAKIAKNKDLYYDALGQAQKGWHEGTGDVYQISAGNCPCSLQGF